MVNWKIVCFASMLFMQRLLIIFLIKKGDYLPLLLHPDPTLLSRSFSTVRHET